jgi:hypothetical protein
MIQQKIDCHLIQIQIKESKLRCELLVKRASKENI